GFLDKPWIAIGPSPDDLDRDMIHVGYIEFVMFFDIVYSGEIPLLLPTEMSSTVRVVSSDDHGITWGDPVDASPTVVRVFGDASTPGLPGFLGTDRVVQGPRPEVASDGTLYVAYLDTTDDGSMKGLAEVSIVRSEDAGKTFSTPVIASVVNEIPFSPRNGYFRYWAAGFPKLTVGDHDDLYMVYTARPPEKPRDDGDIYFIRSLDRGESWTRPLRLNDDEGDGLQFFPEIDLGPDGMLHAIWADMRDDRVQTRYHMYYTQSDNGGTSWGFESEELGFRTGDTRVTDFPSNPNRAFPFGLFIGDYLGLAATDGDVYIVWPDSRLAEFGGINQKIGFARQRAIRSPDIFVSPSAGPGGQNVTIQGFDFQPSMNIMIQLQDSIIATARTNREGRFSSSVYMPVTGEGAQTINVFDESGNFASSSFYTEFGFGNIEQMYGDLLLEVRALNERLGADD
ncbi:MAG: sialidase family protein, partial [Spirochaetia bacterium]